MTRRSGRQSKTKDVSPDQTLTPTRRSSRPSTRKKKEDSETETESEMQKTLRKPDSKMKEIEEKPEDECSKDEEKTIQSSNGVLKRSSSHKSSRHSFKSEDMAEGGRKSRSNRRHRREEKEEIEEKTEDENEQKEEAIEDVEKDKKEVSGENDHESEAKSAELEESEHNEPADKPMDESENQNEERDKEEEEEEEEEVEQEEEEVEREEEEEVEREEQSSSEEAESVEPPARRSTVVSVPDEKTEEDDNAAPEEAADKDSEEEAEDEDSGEVQDNEEDKEEGEIEGSPPPVWAGEQRTWGVSKPNSKLKFLRSRDPGISTSVLKELNTNVKPLSRDILETRARDSSFETPAADSSEDEEANEDSEQVEEPMDTSGGDGQGSGDEAERRKVEDENENPNVKKRRSRGEDEKEEEENKSKSASVRKVSIKKERKEKDTSPLRRPHKAPPLTPTNVLFIYNLTRPFTLGQLRELLSRTGKIAPDGFWIDAIKSKCYVEYETEEQAEETRHALHEVRWPVTNDKVLKVEFTSKDAMLSAQIKAETQEMPTQRKTEPLMMDRNSQRMPVREWDMGKIAEDEDKFRDRDSRVRERDEKDRDRKRKDKRHSVSPGREEPDARRRKRDVEAPAKLLDDLFKKTKTIPCLYWLPLTAEQIAVKEEMRKKHLAELEKRMKKNTSSRSSRDRVKRGRRS